jgi:hypothetical protein
MDFTVSLRDKCALPTAERRNGPRQNTAQTSISKDSPETYLGGSHRVKTTGPALHLHSEGTSKLGGLPDHTPAVAQAPAKAFLSSPLRVWEALVLTLLQAWLAFCTR